MHERIAQEDERGFAFSGALELAIQNLPPRLRVFGIKAFRRIAGMFRLGRTLGFGTRDGFGLRARAGIGAIEDCVVEPRHAGALQH